MSVIDDFLRIIKEIMKIIDLPSIQEIFIPASEELMKNSKKASFGAVQLEDGTIGIVFLNLSRVIKENREQINLNDFKGQDVGELALKFSNTNPIYKTLGLGAINAISQHIFKRANYSFDYATNPLGKLDLKEGDKVGMVGFFPPLIKLINKMHIPLIVVEKKEHFLQQHENWEVTLDPSRLEECNKVLSTSTIVLNETLDQVLFHCKNAEKIALVGPTAGFLPDPLFKKNVHVVGGTLIQDTHLFMKRIKNGIKWGDSAQKYCIESISYPGYKKLWDISSK